MIEITNNIDEAAWEKLVENSSNSTFFQTKECYDFYASLSFLEPFICGVTEDGKLKGLVCGYIVANGGKLKRFFSRRAIIHGGPMLADDISNEALAILLKQTRKNLERKAIYIEFRNSNNYSIYRSVFEENDFQYLPHLNYTVNTQYADKITNKISESKRRQIRKAKLKGVEVIETNAQKDIDEFYAILFRLYQNKVKKPLFPKEFFEKMVSLPHAHLFVAKYDNRIISGMACVTYKNETVYEWFVCGDKEMYNHLYPSVAITNAAVEYAAKNGFMKFDFMGAGKPDEEYGVREFKEKFGGKLVEYGRYICVNSNLLYKIGAKTINLIRKF